MPTLVRSPTFPAQTPYGAYLSRDARIAEQQIEALGEAVFVEPSHSKVWGVPGAGYKFRASENCAAIVACRHGCNVYHIQGLGGGLYIAEIPEESPALTPEDSEDISSPMKVIFMREIPAGLTFRDVIGMGPNRPTWDQVKQADLLIVDNGHGVQIVHKTADLFR